MLFQDVKWFSACPEVAPYTKATTTTPSPVDPNTSFLVTFPKSPTPAPPTPKTTIYFSSQPALPLPIIVGAAAAGVVVLIAVVVAVVCACRRRPSSKQYAQHTEDSVAASSADGVLMTSPKKRTVTAAVSTLPTVDSTQQQHENRTYSSAGYTSQDVEGSLNFFRTFVMKFE